MEPIPNSQVVFAQHARFISAGKFRVEILQPLLTFGRWGAVVMLKQRFYYFQTPRRFVRIYINDLKVRLIRDRVRREVAEISDSINCALYRGGQDLFWRILF